MTCPGPVATECHCQDSTTGTTEADMGLQGQSWE